MLSLQQGALKINNTLLFLGISILLATILAYDTQGALPTLTDYQQWIAAWATGCASCFCIFACLIYPAERSKEVFYKITVWGVIAVGIVEAMWGISQILEWTPSHHALFKLTGSFYNPGPYSGYLAMILPVCLSEFYSFKQTAHKTIWKQVSFHIAATAGVLFVIILPAGMSRSAWVAAIISCLWVAEMYNGWCRRSIQKLKKEKGKGIAVILTMVLLLSGISMFFYYLKADSANGRWFMWKISCLAIAEKPLTGHGANSFAMAYGKAQENYFAAGNYSKQEELVAGSPSYAFNEYLQIGVEYGLLYLALILFLVGVCLWKGYRKRRWSACGGIIAILIFSLSSYPMQFPGFVVTVTCLLAACVINCSRTSLLSFAGVLLFISGCYWNTNRYDACKQWSNARLLYTMGAYSAAEEAYQELYPLLKEKGRFLYEYGHSLHELKKYKESTVILKEAEQYNCDPMILNLIAENFRETKQYREAEHYLVRSTHMLPGRIYPYYLLAKLYAEPDFFQPEKLIKMAEIVQTKEPKVQSTAIKEMRKEMTSLKREIFKETDK